MNKIKITRLILGRIQTNCYLVSAAGGGEAIVIDPADEAEKIIAAAQEENLTVRAVLLTHGHYDHIGAAAELKRHYGIKIYANELEQEVLTSTYNNLSELMGGRAFAISADELLADGQRLQLADLDIQAISTPGHTKGGMSYLVSADGEQVLFSGDTLFQGSVGRYDFPTSSGRELFDSIKKKLLLLDDGTLVCPGHGAVTTIGDERDGF